MKSKRIVLFIALLFMVGVVSCGGGKQRRGDNNEKGDNMTGEATGYGQIFDNDSALARDRAIDDAMNKLVKKVLGTSVSGRSVVKDFALVESIVEARSSGMVKDWKILKEGAQQGAFVVTLRGTVYPQAVNDTIASTLQNYGRPKFMVLIRETFEGKQNMPGFTVTELTMMEIMGNAGFEFVDAAMTQQLIKRERRKMSSAMNGQVDAKTQGMLLDDAGAECIIIGTARTSDQSAVMRGYGIKNMKSKQAILNLKAIDVYTGRILASTSANMPGVHIDARTASKTAIQRCLRKILGNNDEEGNFKSGPFMNQITRKFLKAATQRMIMMTIAGLDFKDLTKFKNQVKGRVRGVKKIYSRGQTGKASKIEVEFAGKTTDLAEELNAKAEGLGFEIDIKSTFPNKILLTVRRIK